MKCAQRRKRLKPQRFLDYARNDKGGGNARDDREGGGNARDDREAGGNVRDDKGGGWVTGVMHKGTVKGCTNEARGEDFFYFSLSI